MAVWNLVEMTDRSGFYRLHGRLLKQILPLGSGIYNVECEMKNAELIFLCGGCPRTPSPRSIWSLPPSVNRLARLIGNRGRRSNACDSDSRQGLCDARHRPINTGKHDFERRGGEFFALEADFTALPTPPAILAFGGTESDCDGFSGPNDPINWIGTNVSTVVA